jgi:8-oxo-dGTP diphosphatase
MLHRISAGAIVRLGDELLLVRHQRPGKYDFWVAPGGGVKGEESLAQAAARETQEETGFTVSPGRLLYVEELVNPECRHVKFWFEASLVGGTASTAHPEAVAEFIVQTAWLGQSDFEGKTVFPSVLTEQYWQDHEAGLPSPRQLPLRRMEFW